MAHFKEKVFSKSWFINYSLIVVGAFILASGFVFFITPYKIVPGGSYGISIVIHHVTKGVFSWVPNGFPVGLMALMIDIPLTIIGVRVLGPKFGIKTVVGFVCTAIFVDTLTFFYGENPLVEGDALLSSIFGGLLIGIGLGIIFKSKATSGGTDIVAMILAKYSKLTVGQLLIYVDSVIVLLGLVVFADWKIPLYSLVVIFITGKTIDIVSEGTNFDRTLFIISKESELIRNFIIEKLERGGTYIPGTGMYQGDERTIIFVVVNRREMALLEEYIHSVDPEAFITIIEASEIYGDGFRSLTKKLSD
ncbi:MAG: YitT family protein [Bacteroidales bacterium]